MERRHIGLIAAAGLLAVGGGGGGRRDVLSLDADAPPPFPDVSPSVRKERNDYARSFGRGRGKQAKPKKRPNRLTISKRVRRKHRRAR
jgi:hypothetical protein